MELKKGNETFKILYENNDYLLVKSTKKDSKFGYGPYSFGLKRDFYSFYWFPVNQSCLHKSEAIERLNNFIKIDKKYEKILPASNTIKIWHKMLKALKKEEL